MRPIQLSSHTRPVSTVLFNVDGDLLYTSAKDTSPILWYTHNGERVGTYNGHTGAVLDISLSRDGRTLASASGDGTVRLWNSVDGQELMKWVPDPKLAAPVRSIDWNCGDTQLACGTGRKNSIYICTPGDNLRDGESDTVIEKAFPKQINKILWGPMNRTVIACSDDGTIGVFDAESGKELKRIEVAEKAMTDMIYSKDKTMLFATSKDQNCYLFDLESWSIIKTYKGNKPLNCVALHPFLDLIVCGGGQAAIEVTTTVAKEGMFDLEFFHVVLEEKIGEVKAGHFSPVNAITFDPTGEYFVTGAEEGNSRIFKMEAGFPDKFRRMENHYGMGQSKGN